MTEEQRQRLRGIKRFDQLIAFLRDELDWPIEQGHDEDDLTFDWSDDLGLKESERVGIKEIKQLRPLETGQPWGIFFVEFESARLPITPLRRLLQALVRKRRASKGVDRRAWELEDLLFIATTGDGARVELHLLAFFDSDQPSVEIRSLPWRPYESPQRHLQRLAGELLPKLAWPGNPDDAERWRRDWRDAFRLRHGESIR